VFFLFVLIFVIIIVGGIMKDKVILLSGIICYILSFLFIVFYLFMEFSVINLYSPIERVKMLLFVFIFMYLGCYLLYKENRCKKFKLGKFNLWILFILYVVMLLNMTLFDSYFGRVSGTNYLLDFSNISNRFNLLTNLVPFDTVSNYFIALSNGNISLGGFVYNIFGNIIAFMPLSLFVPKLIPIINKCFKYFVFASLFIIFIECMQFVLDVGTLDIDDYILNIFGSMLCYFFINIKCINRFVDKVLYLVN
jgi:glycopeptide antibiotics resistance protein